MVIGSRTQILDWMSLSKAQHSTLLQSTQLKRALAGCWCSPFFLLSNPIWTAESKVRELNILYICLWVERQPKRLVKTWCMLPCYQTILTCICQLAVRSTSIKCLITFSPVCQLAARSTSAKRIITFALVCLAEKNKNKKKEQNTKRKLNLHTCLIG